MKSWETKDPILKKMLEKTEKVTFADEEFRSSSFSKPRHKCVEVAVRDGVVALRDSKNPDAPVLKFVRSEWECFVQGVKNREFDIQS